MTHQLSAKAERLVAEFYPYTMHLARRTAYRLPDQRWREDLISAGVEALIVSAERWDDTQGVRFDFYLRVRIPGAVIDEWRVLTRTCRPYRPLPLSLERLQEETGDEGLAFDPQDPEPSPEDVLLLREALVAFRRACRSPRDVEVVRASCLGHRELQEIAREHHVDPATLSHDLQRLRRSLP